MTTELKRFFKKGNQWELKPLGDEPLTATLTIRLTESQKQKIKSVPNWQEHLRNYIDTLETQD